MLVSSGKMSEMETDKNEGTDDNPLRNLDKSALMAVLQFLNKNNLQSSEEILRRETGFHEAVDSSSANLLGSVSGGLTDGGEYGAGSRGICDELATYVSDDSPRLYHTNYSALKRFVDKALDMYKYELGQLLYPVFVHMYLALVYNGHRQAAVEFMQMHSGSQESFYRDDLKRLSQVERPEHMQDHELVRHFRGSHYTVRLCRDSYVLLKRHMQEKSHALLMTLVHDHIVLDVFDGVPRGRLLVRQTAGALEGDPGRQVNRMKMYYGLPKEPDIQLNVPAGVDDDPDVDADRPKKPKKPKRDSLMAKKGKHDPNAPSLTRIPLPDLREVDKRLRAKLIRESAKRVNLGPDTPPSICFYTLLNTAQNVTCASLCEDSSMLAVGFGNSTIRVWSLMPKKLSALKSAEELADIDKDADDVLVRMMDERSAEQSRSLLGHSGPVYAVSFSPQKNLLLSCSEDGTIRLWSLQTWTCLVCYKGHVFPVWDVQFSPHGHYFCSAGHDRTARLWSTDHHQPLRVMTGHFADVDCVTFHPNSNYIASGSSDRSVRVWDVTNATCVRILTGHKGGVQRVLFAPDGRFLVSAAADKHVLCWDMATGYVVAALSAHTTAVYSLQFSRDSSVLATAGLDECIKVWDYVRMVEDVIAEEVAALQTTEVRDMSEHLLIGTYTTKHTPVIELHFSRRNLLLAVGPFHG